MTQKLRMPHELRPAYYPRIAQKYRELDLEDPGVVQDALTKAIEERDMLSALDPVFIFYNNQVTMLQDYAAMVKANARPVEEVVQVSHREVVKPLLCTAAVVLIPALWALWVNWRAGMPALIQ